MSHSWSSPVEGALIVEVGDGRGSDSVQRNVAGAFNKGPSQVLWRAKAGATRKSFQEELRLHRLLSEQECFM